jgi:hypothetical protein
VAIFQKFYPFVEALAKKKHNFGADTLKFMLTNSAPSSLNAVKADLTEIAAGNGYSAGGLATTIVGASQSGGVFTLIVSDITWSASGGDSGPFWYCVLYNDSATNDDLIEWFDYSLAVTIPDGNNFIVDSDQINGILQLA